MATSYTSLLGLALPATGELSGTWGDTVNNYISTYLDSAVAGSVTITADTTLTKTTGSSLGSTSSQYAIIIASPASANITITAPASSKAYIINNTSGTYTVKIVGAGPTTGVTLAVNEKAIVAWNGSDFVKIASSVVSLTTGVTGTLPVGNGGTGAATFTANNVLLGNGTSALQVVAPGTNGNLLTSNGTTWQSTTPTFGSVASVAQSFTGGIVSVTGSPVTTSGTLALSVAGTSGGVPYFSSGTTWASSAALTQYGVVYGGGAGAAPVATAAGTTGQVLTATTGSAPSWSLPGGMTLISNLTATPGVSEVSLTGIASYKSIVCITANVTLAGISGLRIYLSSNNGSTYTAAGYLTLTNISSGWTQLFNTNFSGSYTICPQISASPPSGGTTQVAVTNNTISGAINAIKISSDFYAFSSGSFLIYGFN